MTAQSREDRGWLAEALEALGEVNAECAEEGYPEIEQARLDEAARILRELADQPVSPTVYPDEDGDLVLHFKVRDERESVVILLEPGGEAMCSTTVGGLKDQGRYERSGDCPDGFVTEALELAATRGRKGLEKERREREGRRLWTGKIRVSGAIMFESVEAPDAEQAKARVNDLITRSRLEMGVDEEAWAFRMETPEWPDDPTEHEPL